MEKAVAVDGTNEFRLLYKVSLGTHVNVSIRVLKCCTYQLLNPRRAGGAVLRPPPQVFRR